MTRKEAHKLVKYKKLPLGGVASCPFCQTGGASIRRPYNWGDVEKIKAQVAAHILENHAHKIR